MNLLLRVLSVLILIPPTVYAAYMGGIFLGGLLALIYVLGMLEYCHIRTQKTGFFEYAWVFVTLLCGTSILGHQYILGVVCGFFLILFALFICVCSKDPDLALRKSVDLVFGSIYIGLGVASIYFLREGILGVSGTFTQLIVMALIVWSNDIFAYFGGRFFGKHLLHPRVSPKKTWEGAVIGGIMGIFFPYFLLLCISSMMDSTEVPSLMMFMVLGGFGAIILPVGDLFESLLKRLAGLKDSGHLIPGHGGVLDRVDSMLAFAPFVLCYHLVVVNLF